MSEIVNNAEFKSLFNVTHWMAYFLEQNLNADQLLHNVEIFKSFSLCHKKRTILIQIIAQHRQYDTAGNDTVPLFLLIYCAKDTFLKTLLCRTQEPESLKAFCRWLDKVEKRLEAVLKQSPAGNIVQQIYTGNLALAEEANTRKNADGESDCALVGGAKRKVRDDDDNDDRRLLEKKSRARTQYQQQQQQQQQQHLEQQAEDNGYQEVATTPALITAPQEHQQHNLPDMFPGFESEAQSQAVWNDMLATLRPYNSTLPNFGFSDRNWRGHRVYGEHLTSVGGHMCRGGYTYRYRYGSKGERDREKKAYRLSRPQEHTCTQKIKELN